MKVAAKTGHQSSTEPQSATAYIKATETKQTSKIVQNQKPKAKQFQNLNKK